MNKSQLDTSNTLPTNSSATKQLTSNNTLRANPMSANDTTPVPHRKPMGNSSPCTGSHKAGIYIQTSQFPLPGLVGDLHLPIDVEPSKMLPRGRKTPQGTI